MPLSHTLTPWPFPSYPESVESFAARHAPLDRPFAPAPADLPPSAFLPLPECAGIGGAPEQGSVPCATLGTVDPDWLARRSAILRNRGTVDATRVERAYAAGFVDGTPALRADRLARAQVRRFA